MLCFLLFLVAFADDNTYTRFMIASSDILNPTPGPASILDPGHAAMLAFGPYSASDITSFDSASKLWFFSNWSVDTNGCIPNQPFPGACLVFIGGSPVAALVPYKSSTMYAVHDNDHPNRGNNGKWVNNIFGNIIVLFTNLTLTTPDGPQTCKPLDAILYLEQNWVKVGKYPYDGNHRYVVKSRSRYFTTFPVNGQGLTDQLAVFDAIDEDGNVGYGELSGTTHYVSGNSGDIIQHNRLTQTWPPSGSAPTRAHIRDDIFGVPSEWPNYNTLKSTYRNFGVKAFRRNICSKVPCY